MIVTIQKNLMGLSNSINLGLKSKADDMLRKFDKYWDGMKNINNMLIIATVFYPRKKMQFAKMCFEKLYGKESLVANEMYQSVIDVLRYMFKEYSARSDRGEAVQASQTNPAASFGSQEQPSFERINLSTMRWVMRGWVSYMRSWLGK